MNILVRGSFVLPTVLQCLCYCCWPVCCICIKNIYNWRKDEELVRLLRSYDQQISINAIKKIGAPLLGLARYKYYRCYFKFGGTDGLNEVSVIFLLILTNHSRSNQI